MAFIAPRVAETETEIAAVGAAVAAQLAYEAALGSALGALGAVDGVTGLVNGDVRVTFAKARDSRFENGNIAPLARAALVNAGLLAGYMPVARRLP